MSFPIDSVTSSFKLLSEALPGSPVAAVWDFYINDPLAASILLCVSFTLYCWIASLVTGNCSQVDRLWSLLPPIYSWVFALHPNTSNGASATRVYVMSLLVTIWGSRLTYNFWRKGGYKAGEEDYRWPELRKAIDNKFLFQLFNLFFIAIYQNILIYLFSIPIAVAWSSHTPFGVADIAITALYLLLLAGEIYADQAQWHFQSKKWAMIKNKEPRTGAYLGGFIIDGPFKYSRHPNFFCEISLWWVVYLFSVTATGNLINWTILGTILLTLLFQGSTVFTEKITLSKYPLYAKYQQCTPCLLPRPYNAAARAVLLEELKVLGDLKK